MQSPLRSQRLTSPSLPSATRAALDARRPSINYLINPMSAPRNATPRPTLTILDYLLDVSILSRLEQADLELDELSSFSDSSLPMNENDITERRRRRIERANEAEKAKGAVESMVAGVLSNHRTRLPPSDLSSDLQHRLYLAQLTNLVYSRFDALPSSTHIHHHLHSSSGRRAHSEVILQLTRQNDHLLTHDINRRQQLFETPISSRRCRRHRKLVCARCLTYLEDGPGPKRRRVDISGLSNLEYPPPPPGLIDAIPPFLKTSAMGLRRELEEEGKSRAGMSTKWYDLFLELLTQAAIESYFCDGRAGLEPILEIFSYGDADDEEIVMTAADDSDDSEEEEDEEIDEEQSLRPADHHLLFPKTKVTVEFAKRLRDRENEFFLVKGTLEEHFQALANKYPLQRFECMMREYISEVRATMEKPVLMSKYEPDFEIGPSSPPVSSRYSSSGSVSPSSSASTASTCSYSNFHSKGPIPAAVLISSGDAILVPNGPDGVVNDDSKYFSEGDSEDNAEDNSEDDVDDYDDDIDIEGDSENSMEDEHDSKHTTTQNTAPEMARRDSGNGSVTEVGAIGSPKRRREG